MRKDDWNLDSRENFKKIKGKVIETLTLSNDVILIKLEDEKWEKGETFWIWDDGQECCEYRFITTDDDLSFFSGSTLLDIHLKQAPDGPSRDDQDHAVHEIQFLELKTSKGVCTFETHDEHNGAYGGFTVRISRSEPEIIKWKREKA